MDNPTTETRSCDALRRNGPRLGGAGASAQSVSPAASRTAGPWHSAAATEPVDDLAQAVEAKKRDNLVLGETMLHLGLLARSELAALETAQANPDTVESLLAASAIRSRLGEILLKARHITSNQLEAALRLQRENGQLLGEILVGQGWLDRDTLDAALALQTPRADL